MQSFRSFLIQPALPGAVAAFAHGDLEIIPCRTGVYNFAHFGATTDVPIKSGVPYSRPALDTPSPGAYTTRLDTKHAAVRLFCFPEKTQGG
jgi:hypothetical protein